MSPIFILLFLLPLIIVLIYISIINNDLRYRINLIILSVVINILDFTATLATNRTCSMCPRSFISGSTLPALEPNEPHQYHPQKHV